MDKGDLVAFTANSRYGEWNRGEMAYFEGYLVKYPENQATIVTLTTYPGGIAVWALEDEIRPHFEQLTLF